MDECNLYSDPANMVVEMAWLLRADLRKSAPAGSPVPQWFRIWWALEGRRSYPAWAHVLGDSLDELLDPLPEAPRWGAFGMNPALQFLVRERMDLAAAFDVATESGIWAALAWFYVHGLQEYGLAQTISQELKAALDSTPPFFDDISGMQPTWLMFFLWRSSEGLQKRFDLHSATGRMEYIHWFLCEGIANTDLHHLVAERWRHWMMQELSLPELAGVTISRAALLMWKRRPDLRQVFPLNSPDSVRGLSRWANGAKQTEPALRWLNPVGRTSVPVAVARPFGVNLIGFAFGELGIGEDLRMAAAACEAVGIPFSVVNIDPGTRLRQADMLLAEHVAKTEHAPYAVNLFCLTGFDTARAVLESGPSLLTGRINVGWWPWELPVWPRGWSRALNLVDEIWAATRFTEAMYRAATAEAAGKQISVAHMPLPVDVGRTEPVRRAKLGLPRRSFLFLYVFDFNSYLRRKNPQAVLAAFQRAFDAKDTNVGLVLKTMNGNPADREWQEFARICAGDPRIVILDRTLSRGEVLGLIQECDAYISLHRAEGFGRTLAEALLFGKPVIGTDFSGTTDFLDASNGFPVAWKKAALQPGDYPFVGPEDRAWWAEPEVEAAAKQMRAARAAAADPDFAPRVRADAERRFSPARIGALMRERLVSVIRAGQATKS